MSSVKLLATTLTRLMPNSRYQSDDFVLHVRIQTPERREEVLIMRDTQVLRQSQKKKTEQKTYFSVHMMYVIAAFNSIQFSAFIVTAQCMLISSIC